MDEYLIQTLTRLAKSNINVLGVTNSEILFEFQWRPPDSPKKWTKTAAPYDRTKSLVGNLYSLLSLVTALRKELE